MCDATTKIDQAKPKKPRSSNIIDLDCYASQELELMKTETAHRIEMEKRRLPLDEQRLEYVKQARKDDAEIRKLTIDAQKAMAEAYLQ